MIDLTIRTLPAFYSLYVALENITETHGEAKAIEWFDQALKTDFDLFIEVSTSPPKPQLTILRGGA